MLEDLGASTLCFDQDHDPVFFSCLSIKPAMLPPSMLGDYSTIASSTPSCFLCRTDCWEIRFSSRRYSAYFFFSSFLFWIIIPTILPATMLGYYSMSASLMPSNFSIVVSIYWKSASYRSSLDLATFVKTTNRSGPPEDLPTCQ
jgi:hypothetical protein